MIGARRRWMVHGLASAYVWHLFYQLSSVCIIHTDILHTSTSTHTYMTQSIKNLITLNACVYRP
jgi:hypothetical protein